MLRRRRRKANLHQIWPMAKHRSYKRPNVTRLPWGTAALLFIVVFVVGVAISQWRGLAQSESPTISTTASLAFAGIKPAEPNMEAANQQQPPKRSAPAYAMPRSNIIFDKFRIFGFCHTGGGENCVVDGDTFWIDGVKIRVADIDAPETHPPRCPYEAELGERATARLRELLNAGPIELETLSGRDEDRYGRKLRVVVRRTVARWAIGLSARGWRGHGAGRRDRWCLGYEYSKGVSMK